MNYPLIIIIVLWIIILLLLLTVVHLFNKIVNEKLHAYNDGYFTGRDIGMYEEQCRWVKPPLHEIVSKHGNIDRKELDRVLYDSKGRNDRKLRTYNPNI